MNPKKLTSLDIKIAKHRVIVPVYIPNLENYYSGAFDSLKLCIHSLLQTIPDTSSVTIINNNCAREVSLFLTELFHDKKIDQLVLNSINKGKVEAVLDIFRNSKEDLVTISDCDVLFKQGWLLETKKIFNTFPKVGYVSPLPLPESCNYFSKWSWYYGIISGKLVKEEHSDLESLKLFNKSILSEKKSSEIDKRPFKLKKDKITAVLGAGHFCGTYNKNVVSEIPKSFSGNTFTGAEKFYFDKPVQDAGFLRLATDKAWVYHISVNVEDWMRQVLEENNKTTPEDIEVNISSVGYRKNRIVNLLMKSRFKKLRYRLAKTI